MTRMRIMVRIATMTRPEAGGDREAFLKIKLLIHVNNRNLHIVGVGRSEELSIRRCLLLHHNSDDDDQGDHGGHQDNGHKPSQASPGTQSINHMSYLNTTE